MSLNKYSKYTVFCSDNSKFKIPSAPGRYYVTLKLLPDGKWEYVADGTCDGTEAWWDYVARKQSRGKL